MNLRELSKICDSANKTEFTKEEREKLAKEGLALPDGSFPIRNKQDLRDAIAAIGLGRNYQKTKKWIIKRARELDAVDMLPEKWKVKDSDESLKEVIENAFDFGGKVKLPGTDLTLVVKDTEDGYSVSLEGVIDVFIASGLGNVTDISESKKKEIVDRVLEEVKLQKVTDDSDGFSKEEKELFKDIESKISEWSDDGNADGYSFFKKGDKIIFEEMFYYDSHCLDVASMMANLGYKAIDDGERHESRYCIFVEDND